MLIYMLLISLSICLIVLKDSLCKKKQDESCLALRAFLLPLLRPLISYIQRQYKVQL